MFGWKVVFPGRQLCSIPKYRGLPCAASLGLPQQRSIPGYPGVTPCRRQEGSLSPANCGDLGLLIPPLGAPASEGTWGLPHVQALRPSPAVPLLQDRGKRGSG